MDIKVILTTNDFINSGKCVYEDDYGNRVQMFRKESGKEREKCFTAKLRFKNKNVRADSIHVTVPFDNNKDGETLHLEFLDGVDHTNDKDIQNGISAFTELVQRWIVMMNAIIYLDAPEQLVMKANPYMTKEQIAQYKLSLLAEYEELRDLVDAVMSTSGNFTSHI
jgi:hypothetical protein